MTVAKRFLQVPLYPFLIALAPVFNIFILNRLALNIFDIVRPAILYLVLAIVAVTVSRIVTSSNRRAAMLGCILILGVISYGFAFHLAHNVLKPDIPNSVFVLVWLILIGALYIVLALFFRRMRGSLRDITIVFNIFSMVIIVAVIMPLILAGPVAQDANQAKAPEEPPVHEWLQSKIIDRDSTSLPDVYYIILDAYARGDVLQSRFDYDNSDFLDWLETKGFFVGHQGHSNYPWTHLSLSATLNGEYLNTLIKYKDDLVKIAPIDNYQRSTFFKWVISKYAKNSRVHRFFSSLGYSVISNDTGYSITRKEPTSLSGALFGPINQFEEALISHSLIRPLIPIFRNMTFVQELEISNFARVLGTLEGLQDAAHEPGPKFVFYHVVSPHEPFCFNEEGEMIPPHPVYDASTLLTDKFEMPGYADWFRENYPVNLAGLNHYLKETIQSILDSSGGNAIVIIQSDHGPHSGYDFNSAANTDVVERFGILNAVYLPADIPRDGLEQTMSSVNTFRVVLSNTFGLDLPVLEGRAYYHLKDLDFEEVTDRLSDQAGESR